MMSAIHVAWAIAVGLAATLLADDDTETSRTIAKIELLGGVVERAESLPGSPVVGISIEPGGRFGWKHLHLLNAFPHLKQLHLAGFRVSEKSLQELTGLGDLEELIIDDMHFELTDDALRELAKLKNLKMLKTHVNQAPAREEVVAARLPQVKVDYAPPIKRLSHELPGLKITGVTDRHGNALGACDGGKLADGTPFGPTCYFMGKQSSILVTKGKIILHSKERIEFDIPDNTKSLWIHDVDGKLHVIADGRRIHGPTRATVIE